MRPAALVTLIFLALVALTHLLRLVYSVEVRVGEVMLPMWVSLFAVVGPGALAIWLWREQGAGPGRPAS